MKTRILSGLLAVCLTPVVAMAAIEGVSVNPSPSKAGEEVFITLTGDAKQNRCGLSVEFGDGEVRDIKIDAKEGLFPRTLTKAYAKPGAYAIAVTGKSIFRGFNSYSPCEGKGMTAVTVASGDSVAMAVVTPPAKQPAALLPVKPPIEPVLVKLPTEPLPAKPPTETPILRIEPGEHTSSITRAATDTAGRWLVTASFDKTARVWSLGDGRLVSTLRPPIFLGSVWGAAEGNLLSVAISPDGQTVAVGGVITLGEPTFSVLFFDRASGQLLRRMTGLIVPAIGGMAFSPDGRSLAVMLGKSGLQLFNVADGRLIAKDDDYGGNTYSYIANFSTDGRLITTSYDGLLRLYRFDGSRLTLLAKRPAIGGKLPGNACFSPDGKHIAVGFEDTSAVNVLDGNSLELHFAPDTAGINKALSRIVWSQDGKWLYASGATMNSNKQFFIRRWANSGTGVANDWPVGGGNAISSLVPLPGGQLAFSTFEPSWGIVKDTGEQQLLHAPVIVNFFYRNGALKLSRDGARVSFNYEPSGKSIAVFDSVQRKFLADDTPELAPALSNALGSGIVLTDIGTEIPKLNGKQLQLDGTVESAAMRPDDAGFVLGTPMTLYFFDREGKQIWEKFTEYPAVQVNVSRDGRWVVAAHMDGTIRWYRASDGVEQLAFFPHADRKRWIMWTPEGYYDASPGGEDIIGWHLNQGKDKEARFIPSGQLYDVFFRPDIVQAKFRGDDISGLITITATQALKNPPPTLKFTKVPSSSKSNKEKVCYKATSTGGGIGEVRLFQNGKLVKSDGFYREAVASKTDKKIKLASLDSATIQRGLRDFQVVQKAHSPIASTDKGNEFEECQELEALPGENEISVAAFNAPNTIQSTLETARFKADRKPEEPHLYVLGVGIDHYGDSSVDLQYAAKDAKDFRTMMQEKAGSLYKPQNIHIEGLSDSAANKDGIQKAIQALSAKVKPWDSFILFVASHGVMLGNQYYIITAGFNGSMNLANFISSNEIVGMSKNIKALSQLFIFDTCHAGGVDNLISGLYDARMSVMAKKMGLHIYASAGSTQTAMDGYEGNGLFTHTLLKSMREARAIDSNQDGQVSVVELGQQARQDTMGISKKLGYQQSPNIINFGRDNSLFRVK